MSKENNKRSKKICNWEKYYYSNGIYFLDTTTMDLVHKVSEMLQQPENVVKRVLEVKEQHPKQNYQFLASKLSRELGETLKAEDVKEIIEKARELVKWTKEKLKEMNDWIKDTPKYEIINDEYVIYTNVNSPEWKVKQVYRLPVELVDNIFNDYSRYWGNMSWQAIMSKYDLKPKVWNLIKSNIWLYKDSNILSPLSMDNASKEWKVEEIIEEATYKNFQDKYKHKYKDAHITNLEKLVKKQAKILGTIEGFLEHIEPIINSVRPIKIQALKHKNYKWSIPVYHFWDTHLWKNWTEKVVARMMTLADDIIKHPSKKIWINFWWDIWETLVSGWMHKWQIESMEWVYNFDLFMYWVDVFVAFLEKILRSGKEIYSVWKDGNHDRPTQLSIDSPERTYALIFFKFLEQKLSQAKIEFNIIKDSVWSYEIDGIQYLTGHEPIHNKQPEKIAWKLADTNKHVIYTTFHLHNEWIYTGKNVTQIAVNWLAWEWEYDSRLQLHSYPWYTVTERNEFGLPDIYSKRLP